MRQMPLSKRVIFSDWHGVLSRDPFWTSIRLSATHPLHAQLEAGMAGVFDPARNIANEWMKGLLSSDQVIAEMGIQLHGRFRDDFLARRLDLRSEEHTSELQSRFELVCRLLLEKTKLCMPVIRLFFSIKGHRLTGATFAIPTLH